MAERLNLLCVLGSLYPVKLKILSSAGWFCNNLLAKNSYYYCGSERFTGLQALAVLVVKDHWICGEFQTCSHSVLWWPAYKKHHHIMQFFCMERFLACTKFHCLVHSASKGAGIARRLELRTALYLSLIHI